MSFVPGVRPPHWKEEMGKLAAIEARATQYPASTNDVVWLVVRVRQLREALESAKRDMVYFVTGTGPFSVYPEISPAKHFDERIAAITATLEELNEPDFRP